MPIRQKTPEKKPKMPEKKPKMQKMRKSYLVLHHLHAE
jgi:hypothetical protein